MQMKYCKMFSCPNLINLYERKHKKRDNTIPKNIAVAKEFMKKQQSYFEGFLSNNYRLDDKVCLKFTEQQ